MILFTVPAGIVCGAVLAAVSLVVIGVGLTTGALFFACAILLSPLFIFGSSGVGDAPRLIGNGFAWPFRAVARIWRGWGRAFLRL